MSKASRAETNIGYNGADNDLKRKKVVPLWRKQRKGKGERARKDGQNEFNDSVL